jgi:hypothetical protein
MRGGGTPEDGSMKFCTYVESLDVIKCANFHVYLMINLRARWGSKMSFSLWNAYGSYYIALRFRAGKWKQQKSFFELEKPAKLWWNRTNNAGNVSPLQASVSISCFFCTLINSNNVNIGCSARSLENFSPSLTVCDWSDPAFFTHPIK